jgi:hypothetical protein
MIAAEFWGVKARKKRQNSLDGRDLSPLSGSRPVAIFARLYRENCTLLASCVKFTTNKSVARQNRKAELRKAVPSQHQNVMKSPVD